MDSWLTAHGQPTFATSLISQLAVSIPAGHTLKRVIFNWKLAAIVNQSDTNQIIASSNYFGMQTYASTRTPPPPDPSALPLTTTNPPMERWLHWERRRLLPRTQTLMPNGSMGIVCTDDGTSGDIDNYGQVIANVTAPATLDIWFTWRFLSWPPNPSTTTCAWWLRALIS